MNKRDLSNTSFAFNLGSTTFLCDYKYSIPNLNMNIITYILLLYILRTYVYIFCIVYSLYEFVDEKWKINSNQIKSNNTKTPITQI